MVGLRIVSRRFGEEKNIFHLQGLKPRTVQPVAYLLHRLRCPGFKLFACNAKMYPQTIRILQFILLVHMRSISGGARLLD